MCRWKIESFTKTSSLKILRRKTPSIFRVLKNRDELLDDGHANNTEWLYRRWFAACRRSGRSRRAGLASHLASDSSLMPPRVAAKVASASWDYVRMFSLLHSVRSSHRLTERFRMRIAPVELFRLVPFAISLPGVCTAGMAMDLPLRYARHSP